MDALSYKKQEAKHEEIEGDRNRNHALLATMS
jgi:hypothetical protein